MSSCADQVSLLWTGSTAWYLHKSSGISSRPSQSLHCIYCRPLHRTTQKNCRNTNNSEATTSTKISEFKQYKTRHTFNNMATRLNTFILYSYEIKELHQNLTSTHTDNSLKECCKMNHRNRIMNQIHIHISKTYLCTQFSKLSLQQQKLSTYIIALSHTAVQILIRKSSKLITYHFNYWTLNASQQICSNEGQRII